MKKKDIDRLLGIIVSTQEYILHENGYNSINSLVNWELIVAKELLEQHKAEKASKKVKITEIISQDVIDQLKETNGLITALDESMDRIKEKLFACKPIEKTFEYDNNIKANTSILSIAILTPYTVEELEEFYMITKKTTPHNMILSQLNKAGITSLSNINTLIKMGYCNI